MRPSFRKLAMLVGVTAGTCMHSNASARPISIRALAAEEVRLATIANRISLVNTHACATRGNVTGLVLHDLTRYERELRGAVSQSFSLGGGIGVIGVVPGSAAARAGLSIDDEIVAIGGRSVEIHDASARPKSYGRISEFDRQLQSELLLGQATLTIRRAGKAMQVNLPAQPGCGGKLVLSSSSVLNAWADGEHVIVTTGMSALARTDDEIAFVIAHEMAHNILRHTASRNAQTFFLGVSRLKNGEIDADRFAVQLMAGAGYQPAGGISFLKNAKKRLWWSFSLDHPGFGSRIKVVAKAMKDNALAAAAAGNQEQSFAGNMRRVARLDPTRPEQL